MRSSSLALAVDPMPRRGGRLSRALHAARIVHPFPTLLNVAATGALAFIAARGIPPTWTLATMLLVMFCAQAAIGVTNDVFDRDLDARAKRWKPLVAGVVSLWLAVALAIALATTSLALALTLGPVGGGLAALGLACGLAYDARLKRTAFSAVPYMIAIPVLPLWVWAIVGDWRAALWWLPPMGSLIGLALHLANTLPDIDDDASNGVRGLAHRLGARRSMLLASASFGGALALSAAAAAVVEYDWRIYAPTASLGVLALTATLLLYAVRRDRFALQIGFAMLAVGSAVLAPGWLAAI